MHHALHSPFASGALLFATLFATPTGSPSVTTATVDIGGPGALGSEGGDPPVLSNGVIATGTVTYVYDSRKGLLEVTIDNTTPQLSGETNPVITEVYFNLPALAVTKAKLIDQAPPGGSGGDDDDGYGYRRHLIKRETHSRATLDRPLNPVQTHCRMPGSNELHCVIILELDVGLVEPTGVMG